MASYMLIYLMYSHGVSGYIHVSHNLWQEIKKKKKEKMSRQSTKEQILPKSLKYQHYTRIKMAVFDKSDPRLGIYMGKFSSKLHSRFTSSSITISDPD